MSKQKRSTRPELREGEELVWTGVPCEDKEYNRADRVLMPVSLVALAVSTLFAVSLVVSIVRGGFSAYHIVACLLLIALGGLSVYCWFLRFAAKRRIKSDLIYGVTNFHRVIIKDQGTHEVFEYDERELRKAFVSECDKHGIGTIYLHETDRGNLLDNTGLDILGLNTGLHEALFDIPDCKKVLKLIRSRG